jgi:peroxiredoxin
MTYAVLAAGIYNIAWAVQAICWPNWLFRWAGMPLLIYPEIWQGLGLFLGVWGLGYLAVAAHPVRHWPIVMAGLLSRIFEVGGLLTLAVRHRMPWKFCGLLAAADIAWCVPLGLILWCAYRIHASAQRHASPEIQRLALRTRTNKGRTLLEMSTEKPLLIIFLRTADCPFCREALAQIAIARRSLEQKDAQLVFVHIEADQVMHEFLHSFQLSDVPRVSDPHFHLYRAFGLKRGPWLSVIGPSVWGRGVATLIKYGAGRLTPDLLQMPGVFMVFHGEVLWNFMHQSIADQPRYEDIPLPL